LRVIGEIIEKLRHYYKKVYGLQETQNQERQLVDISHSVER